MAFQRRRRTRKKQQTQALATRKYVKKAIKVATPNRYVNASVSTNVDYAGYIYDLWTNNVPLGTGDENRSGDQLKPLSFDMRGFVVNADAVNQVRIIIFQNKGASLSTGATDVGSVITNAYKGTAQAPQAPISFDYSKRFRVLYDRLFHVGTYTPQRIFHIKMSSKKLSNVWYAGGATAQPIRGGIQMLIITDSAAAGHPAVGFVGRLLFES